MKFIKTYEGFFDFFKKKKRSGDGIYYWTENEIIELESNGFTRYTKTTISPFFYNPSSGEIKTIIIEKLAEVDMSNIGHSSEDWFYNVIISYKNDKYKYSDFDSFESMIKFVKPYIKDVDIVVKKYNL